MKLHIRIYTLIKISYLININMYYVRFIDICNGIIDVDAIGLPMLFIDCAKVIGSSGASSYLRGDLIQ